jgi:hypothetical protein
MITLACATAFASVGGLFASTPATNVSIPIVNPDFNVVLESAGSSVTGTLAGYSSGWGATTFSSPINYSDSSSSSSGYVPGWTGAGGEQILGATTATPNPRSGGSYGYNSYGTTTQTLTTNVLPDTTYLLTLGADIRYSPGNASWYLTAGGTQIGGGAYFGAPAGYRQAPNTVAELVTTGSNVSGALGITLNNTGGGQTLFNNVALVANPSNVPVVTQNTVSVVNLGTAAPTPGSNDQSNLAPTGTPETVSSGGINYYTNNGGAPAGETFTTGSNASGYLLNGITVLDLSEHGGFADGTAITVNLSSASGTNFSTVAVLTGSVPTGTAAASGDYLKLTLANPVTLAANSVYGYSLLTNNGYSGLGVDPNADYAGGQLAMFTPGGSNLFDGTLTTSSSTPNAIFDVSLTPVSAVPDAPTLALLGLGGLALLSLKRKRT